MDKHCSNCGRTDGRFSGSVCAACAQFKQRTGLDRPYRLDGRKEGACPTGEDHYAWKGDEAIPSTKRQRAVRKYRLGSCERCGKPATDRHHKDGNTGNNVSSNIAILCRRCHMEIDGRLEAFVETAIQNGFAAIKNPEPCTHCGKLYKPLRKGLCAACNQYQMIHKTPRPLDGSFPPRRRSSGGNAGKTHCIHGHEFNEVNTHVDKRGRRHCRACDAASAAARYAKIAKTL